MKSICFLMLLLLSTVCFADEKNKGDDMKDLTVFSTSSINEGKMKQHTAEAHGYVFGCSVTAIGMVHSAEFGVFEAKVTVKGPCNASIANKLRKAIAALRAAFE